MAEQFTAASKTWHDYGERGGPALAQVVAVAELLSKSTTLDEANKRATISKLQKNVEQLARLEVVAKEREEACRRIKDKISRNVDADIKETYASEVKRAEQTAARMRVARNEHVMKVARLLNTDEDEELAVVGAVSTGKCPITAAPMTNPMKNTACGHVYSAEGALQLLSQKMKQNFRSLDDVPKSYTEKCPVARCTKFFSAGSLVRDYAAEHSQRLRTATATHNTEDDDADIIV